MRRCLDLESFSRSPVLLDEQVDLGAGVGPPEKQARFASQIGSHAQNLEDHELLEKPAAQGGVRQRGQAPVHGVCHPGVEKVVLLLGDQPLACVDNAGHGALRRRTSSLIAALACARADAYAAAR
jgi:hypothetical protein